MRGAILGNDDLTMLAECERGEDLAKAHYAKALEQNLPLNVHDIVKRQYAGVLSNHAEIRSLRYRYRSNN
ncbi:PA2169 family four-helix-bundle protein [Chitinimonas sp. BJB300]